MVLHSDMFPTFQPLASVKIKRQHRKNLIKGKWSKKDIVKYIPPMDFNPAMMIKRGSQKLGLVTSKINPFDSNQVDVSEIKEGDHIYTWKTAYAYSHHGIYIGGNLVIHVTPVAMRISGTDSELPKHCSNPGCGYWFGTTVFRTCLSCFKGDSNLYRYKYGVGPFEHMLKLRGGTCTTAVSDSPEEVTKRAKTLMQKGFGRYNLIQNNCEDFGIYCKTGLMVLGKRSFIGTSGQGNSWFRASLVAFFAAAVVKASFFVIDRYFHKIEKISVSEDSSTLVTHGKWNRWFRAPFIVVVAAVTFYVARYAFDIGVRPDAVRVEVEKVILIDGENVRVKDKIWCSYCQEWR